MTEAADPLVLDFVEWIAREPRVYSEVVATWKTSCPRLTIWEDAADQGYVARETIAGSKLFDVNFRRSLFEGGKQAIAESTDPAIVMMRTLDPDARAIRKRYEDEVEAPARKAGERIAQALFAVRGTSVAPDATSTLRLSIGTVKGSTEHGKSLPWSTNFAGLYAHATETVAIVPVRSH